MKYKKVIEAKFIDRPNRFVAAVEIDGVPQTVHVKNTGRCRELLPKGATVYLSVSDNPHRKTAYDLIAVIKERRGKTPLIINMDSQIPNGVACEWLAASGLFSDSARIRREVTHKSSRFDIYVEDGERKAFIEVKGVTLEEDGIAMFPDAPTERGVKHLRELTECIGEGYEAYILFVIQMKGVRELRPNDKTHKAFGDALRRAAEAGVGIMAIDCNVTPDTIEANCPVPVAVGN